MIKNTNKIKVGISVGDLNGIGIEIILKTFADERMFSFCTPVIFANNRVISYHKKTLGLETFIQITNPYKIIENKINLINVWQEETFLKLGQPTDISGKYAFESLQAATNALQKKQVDFLVTAPIDKKNIQNKNFDFKGHTDYLSHKMQTKSLMFLISENLKMGLVTAHVPLSEVSKNITADLIQEKIEIMENALQKDFAINRPKIAVLSLNPHGGDGGIIGNEDDKIIKPLLEKMQNQGKIIYGPYAADGFFGNETYREFDAVLGMYHDQGLIPFKMLSFGKGVNFTAGLPFIRTSPDHGTAFQIAGKNKANPSSFREAVFLGMKLFENQKTYNHLKINALEKKDY